MRVFDVKMFNRCSGDVIATFLGAATTHKEAKVECVRRAQRAKRITYQEKMALIGKIKANVTGPVDTKKWTFTIEAREAASP